VNRHIGRRRYVGRFVIAVDYGRISCWRSWCKLITRTDQSGENPAGGRGESVAEDRAVLAHNAHMTERLSLSVLWIHGDKDR
jgi:hypothetical protein